LRFHFEFIGGTGAAVERQGHTLTFADHSPTA
jgi:hypothetical protein